MHLDVMSLVSNDVRIGGWLHVTVSQPAQQTMNMSVSSRDGAGVQGLGKARDCDLVTRLVTETNKHREASFQVGYIIGIRASPLSLQVSSCALNT